MERIPPQDSAAAANPAQQKKGLKREQSGSLGDRTVSVPRKLPTGTSRSDPFALLDKLHGFIQAHAPTTTTQGYTSRPLTNIMEESPSGAAEAPADPSPANFAELALQRIRTKSLKASCVLEGVEQYGLQVREEFEEIQDPLERALFLLEKMKVEQGSANHAQLAILIEAVCAVNEDKDDYTSILQWRHLKHAQNLLSTLCSGVGFEAHMLGLKKWLLFQGLVLVRQLQVMQVSLDELHPRCVIARIIETMSFLSSLPPGIDEIHPKPPIHLSTLKKDLIRTVGRMFPESRILFLQGSVTEQFSTVRRLIPNLGSLQSRMLTPIETPPNIYSVPLPLPSEAERAAKLPKIRAQLAANRPLLSQWIVLARLAYYSPNLSQEQIPPDLIDTLYNSIGKNLFGEERGEPIPLTAYTAIGRKCVESNTQRSSVIYGILLIIKDILKTYILDTTRDLERIADPKAKIFEAFRLFQSYSHVLTELSRLRVELLSKHACPESLAQFDETMKSLSLNLVVIINVYLSPVTSKLLGEWTTTTAFDVTTAILRDLTPSNLANIIKNLTGFRSYFLLTQLLALKYDGSKLNMETEIFNLLAEFPERQRLFLLSPISEEGGGLYESPSAFWQKAKINYPLRILLSVLFVGIRKKAQEALAILVDAHKPKVS